MFADVPKQKKGILIVAIGCSIIFLILFVIFVSLYIINVNNESNEKLTSYNNDPNGACTCSGDPDINCCIISSEIDELDALVDTLFVQPNDSNTEYYLLGKFVAVQPTYEYIIVGAGVSGLYIALSILNQNPDATILILEKLERVGGRTFSLKLNYLPDGQKVNSSIHLELGGMRILAEHQRLLRLLNYTELCGDIEPFASGTRSGDNPYWLRRNRFTVEESSDEDYWFNTYNLKESENCTLQNWTGGYPSCILNQVWYLVQQQNNVSYQPTSPDDWQYVRNNWAYNGVLLNNMAWNNLLRIQNWSNEVIDMLADSNGFFSEFHQQVNAGDVLQEFIGDWASVQTFYTLSEGFDSPSKQLRAILTRYIPAVVNLGINVTGIDRNGNSYLVSGVFTSNNTAISYLANNVILTMPSINLQEQLPAFTPINNPKTRGLVYGATQQRLSKINLVFDKLFGPNNDIFYNGGSFTDMQIGSWYMVEAWRNGTFYDAVLYCDYYNADFWNALWDKDDPYPFDSVHLTTDKTDSLATVYNASNSQVNMALQLLSEMLNTTIPQPLAAFYSPWGTIPDFGGATHLFAVGVNDVVLQEEIWQPVANQSIYICGESYSSVQAWVEGSLQSCDYLLHKLGFQSILDTVSECPLPNATTICPKGISIDRYTCEY